MVRAKATYGGVGGSSEPMTFAEALPEEHARLCQVQYQRVQTVSF